jgi:hypothetical protein
MTADDRFLEKPIMVEKYGRALSPISIASEQGNLRICQVLFEAAGGGNLVYNNILIEIFKNSCTLFFPD